MREYSFDEEARQDFSESYEYYESQRSGLGERFYRELETVLTSVRNQPFAFREVRSGIRKARLKIFPFAIYFRLEQEAIVVIAVYHKSRDPRGWQSRI